MGVAYSEAQTNYFSKPAVLYIVSVYHMFWHCCNVKLPGPGVRKVDSAIYRIAIFSIVLKMIEKL